MLGIAVCCARWDLVLELSGLGLLGWFGVCVAHSFNRPCSLLVYFGRRLARVVKVVLRGLFVLSYVLHGCKGCFCGGRV